MLGRGEAKTLVSLCLFAQTTAGLCVSGGNGALTDVMVSYSCQAHEVLQTFMTENFSAERVQACIGYSCHLFS